MQVFNLQQALLNPQQVESLQLDRSGLEEIPASVQQCINLKELNLNENRIAELPDWLPELKLLKKLSLQNNKLRKLKQDWSTWKSLQVLNISTNQLTTIRGLQLPDQLQELNLSHNRLKTLTLSKLPKHLRRLNVANNSLKDLPDLKGLQQLEWLNAHKNLIRAFPDLPNNIQHIDLGRNRIKDLPNSLDWPELRALLISNNQLENLPPGLKACRQLRGLDLSGNRLQDLPRAFEHLKWLVKLNLDKNHFRKIPAVISQLTILDELTLSGNQLHRVQLGNTQLRRLDLSHNPIHKILELPSSIQFLLLKKIILKDWSFLRRLPNLQHLELRARDRLDILDHLCHLSALQEVQGLLPYGKKKKWLQLLKEDLAPEIKKELVRYWVTLTGEALDIKSLQMALQTNIKPLQLQARKTLLSLTENQEIPEGTKVLQLIGKLQTAPHKISASFTEKEITIQAKTNRVILGKPPFDKFVISDQYAFYSEAQLLDFLQKQEGKTAHWKPEEIQQLQKRLLQANPQQVKLVLLLLSEEPVPEALIPALILAWKLQEQPALKRKLGQLIGQYCPPKYESLRMLPLPKKQNRSTMVKEWLEKSLSFESK